MTFEVGDRVRVVDDHAYEDQVVNGDTGIIVSAPPTIYNHSLISVKINNGGETVIALAHRFQAIKVDILGELAIAVQKVRDAGHEVECTVKTIETRRL